MLFRSMGSDSDYPVMKEAADVLKALGIPHEVFIVSAHRTPHRMVAYALTAQDRGLDVLIAGAGGAAHLPGMVASLTCLPVIGVPVRTKALDGLDSLLSIVQMPAGVPVATVPVNDGAAAGLLAAKMIGLANQEIKEKISRYMHDLAESEDMSQWLTTLAKTSSENM